MSNQFRFPTGSPESQGIPSQAILDYIDTLQERQIELHGIVLARNGVVVTEGYWAPHAEKKAHRLFSAGKAVVMTAFLFAIQDGLFSLDDRLVDLMPEDMPDPIPERVSRMTVYHLLTMTTGHVTDTFGPMLAPGVDRAKKFFELPLEHEPGTHFLYNNGVPDILAILLHRKTGMSIYDYLRPRLFEPLGMDGMTADMNGGLEELPTMAFHTRDLFKLAMLFAQNGRWDGKQVLREDLAFEAGQYHVPNARPGGHISDGSAGYAWQMWRNAIGGFRIDGGRGQFGVVVPELGLVIGINSNESHQNLVLETFWETVAGKMSRRPLPEDPEAYAALQARLRTLSMAPHSTATGCANGVYRLDQPLFSRDTLIFDAAAGTLTCSGEGESFTVPLQADADWTPCAIPFYLPELQPSIPQDTPGNIPLRHDIVAGFDPTQGVTTCAWVAPNTLELHFRSDAWMAAEIFTFRFDGDDLQVVYEDSGSYHMRRRSGNVPRSGSMLLHDAIEVHGKA